MTAEMNGTMRILIAGFGGQGVLFLGKWIAYAGMMLNRQVTWLPSYGPEMRGGTANCAVILSDAPIGSPIVHEIDVLIAMNLPSLRAYEPRVRCGGVILYDSSLIRELPARADVSCLALPAAQSATEAGLDGLGNMILLGGFLRECMVLSDSQRQSVTAQVVPAHKQGLIAANLRAIALGAGGEEALLQEPAPQALRQPRRAG